MQSHHYLDLIQNDLLLIDFAHWRMIRLMRMSFYLFFQACWGWYHHLHRNRLKSLAGIIELLKFVLAKFNLIFVDLFKVDDLEKISWFSFPFLFLFWDDWELILKRIIGFGLIGILSWFWFFETHCAAIKKDAFQRPWIN